MVYAKSILVRTTEKKGKRSINKRVTKQKLVNFLFKFTE